MGEREELLAELMRQVQRKYMQFLEIEKLTKELGDALSGDDRESIQLFLEMRQDAMDKADEIERDINAILGAVDVPMLEKMQQLLDWKREFPKEETAFEAKKIRELSSQIRNCLERTIVLDKRISKKLAGNDSYYAQ